MRNLKTLGVALVAIFAMSAVMASMASADELKGENGAQTLNFTGTQEVTNVLKTTAGSAECKKASLTATAAVPTSDVKVIPSYSECTCIGIACTVDMNSCYYTLTITGAGSTSGSADLRCTTAGDEVTLTSAKCIIHVKPKDDLTNITYKRITNGKTSEVTLEIAVTGIEYSHTNVGPGIGTCTTGSGTTGSLTGSVTVTAAEDNATGGHVGIFLE